MATYAVSDLHGMYSLYEEIKKFIKPEDRVICLGDATDRGPQGWKLLKDILDDPQWEYIMGNHDEMVLEYIDNGGHSWLHTINGGAPTQIAIDEDAESKVLHYRSKLSKAPYLTTYINSSGLNILLSHSGTSSYLDKEKLIWDRESFLDPVPEGFDVIVHGHTPIPYMDECWFDMNMEDKWQEWKHGTAFMYYDYYDKRKFNIDCGAFATKSCCLFDLDTFESHRMFAKEIV